MKSDAREEAAKLVIAVVVDLLKIVTISAGRAGSMVRLASGDLIADAEQLRR
jgi:hypothetical protein